MRTIYKYPLSTVEYQTLSLPQGAEILSIQVQNGKPMLWAVVDTTSPPIEKWTLRICGTGCPIEGGDLGEYLGTIQLGCYVWHFFVVDE